MEKLLFAAARWIEVVEYPQAAWGAVANTVPPLLLMLTTPRQARVSA